MKCRRFLVAVAFGLMFDPAVRAEDWPEFRGPTGQGLAVGNLPVEWGRHSHLSWRQRLPGTGWSSPVVCEGRVYLTSAVPVADSATNDLSLRALCLDAGTGKILWDKETLRENGAKAPRPHSKNSHASPTPVVHDGRLYVHFGHQGTACLDLDGNVVWQNSSLTYQPVHGNGGSPILVDGALIFSCDGSDQQVVVALDGKTGKVLWKTDRKSQAYKKFAFSTPLLITVKGQKQVVSPASDVVCAYDPADGREIWRVRYNGYSVIPRPVFGHGLIFLSTGYDSPSLMAIRPDGQGDVTATHVAWTVRKGAPHAPSPLLVGDELYVISDGGLATCLDARTGKVYWQHRMPGAYSASPISAGGKIYFQSEDGAGVVVKAATEFEQLARNDLGERTLASPAAADGALFIRTEKNLYKFESK